MAWRHPKYSRRLPIQILDDNLPSVAVHLLLFMFSKADDQDCLQIGYAAMMDGIGASRGTIATTLALLIERGWIFVGEKGGSKQTHYMLQVPARRLGMAFVKPTSKVATAD